MKHTLVLLFSVFSLIAFGQMREEQQSSNASAKATYQGTVVEASTNAALEFATVSIYNHSDSSLLGGTLTDVDGRFEIKVSSDDAYAVIEFIGFDNFIINSLPESENKNRPIDLGTIALSVSAEALEEVQIVGEKSENQYSLDKRVFNVGKDLANRGGSAVDILDNVPSVTVDVEGVVSLRGSSGVRILINGKRTGLSDNLRSIPSNQIERVEVITNPSARYEAEGMAGIINIILKKDTRQGFNGSFDLNGGYPTQGGIGANVNYRKNNINWFAGYGLQYRENPSGGYLRNTFIITPELQQITDSETDFDRTDWSNTFRFGLDYFFNQKTSLTGSLRYQHSDADNFITNTYEDYYSTSSDLFRLTTRTDDEFENERQLEYSLSFNKEFSSREHVLRINADYEDELEIEGSALLEDITNFGSPDELLEQRSNNDEGQKEWVIKADYIHPFSKDHKIEFGLFSSFRDITNDYIVEEKTTGTWKPFGNFDNEFIYNENIYAAYAQYGNKLSKKTSYQVGMRYEYFRIITELLNTNEKNERDRGNLFPSVFLNHEFSEAAAAQISYSRRITRPNFWNLNPFLTFNDSRNQYVGNPNLNPEYTNSYELNYLRYWENMTISSGIFYRHAEDVIERLRFAENGQTILRPENLAERDDYGIEMNLNYSAIKWLRLDANATVFRSETNGRNIGESFYNETTTMTGRFTSRFTFWDSDLQLRMNYRAPRETTQGKNKSVTSLDLGWSKDLLPKKTLTVTFSIRDVFNTRKRRYEQYAEDFSSVGEFQWRMRAFNLAFNYRINQKKQRRPGGGYGGDY